MPTTGIEGAHYFLAFCKTCVCEHWAVFNAPFVSSTTLYFFTLPKYFVVLALGKQFFMPSPGQAKHTHAKKRCPHWSTACTWARPIFTHLTKNLETSVVHFTVCYLWYAQAVDGLHNAIYLIDSLLPLLMKILIAHQNIVLG